MIEGDISLVVLFVEEWIRISFNPPNFVMITEPLDLRRMEVMSALIDIQFTSSNHHLSTFTLYCDNQVPLNLYPAMPAIQFEIGYGSSFPFVKTSSFGI